MAFRGQAEYSIDSKGRVAIPARMRSAMSPAAQGRIIITRGFERCVSIYPLDRWMKIEEEMNALSPFNGEARAYIRSVTRWTFEEELDGQGRVMLPKPLIEFAGLTDKALLIGALDRIEVWNPEVFEQYLNEQPDSYETLAERVMRV
jgi:MraZ protein